MGGDISVSSKPGFGSDFLLSLPVRPISRRLPALKSGDPAEKTGKLRRELVLTGEIAQERRCHKCSILVVDDDPQACDIAERYLEKDGYIVDSVLDGEAAISKIQESPPDVVLLDVMLSNMSGWYVLKFIKSHSDYVHIPVIMTSMLDEKKNAYTLGAADYLLKPIEREELIRVVNNCVRKEGIKSILVVDDDADARRLMRMILENDGYNVIEAENGDLGLIRMAETKPILIIMDMVMPGMDGYQFLDLLQKTEVGRSMPVLVMTAMDQIDLKTSQIKNRVQGVVHKGAYSIDTILKEVRRIIGEKT
jgi:hypothetical protein